MNNIIGTDIVKRGMAAMLKSGVIMDVVNESQARIAEEAGAVAVMALEKVPSDIRRDGGVARMSDPSVIEQIMNAVSIPVMAKVRIGHFVEAKILQSMEVDYIDESEVLTPADTHYINKQEFIVPFVCGACHLSEALSRIEEGASMIRSKGNAGTGDIYEGTKHIRNINNEIKDLQNKSLQYLTSYAKDIDVSLSLILWVVNNGKLPVVLFSAGGIVTPADAIMMMELGAEGVFVGSGIFKSSNPIKHARAIVDSVAAYDDYGKVVKRSKNLGQVMKGVSHQ